MTEKDNLQKFSNPSTPLRVFSPTKQSSIGIMTNGSPFKTQMKVDLESIEETDSFCTDSCMKSSFSTNSFKEMGVNYETFGSKVNLRGVTRGDEDYCR